MAIFSKPGLYAPAVTLDELAGEPVETGLVTNNSKEFELYLVRGIGRFNPREWEPCLSHKKGTVVEITPEWISRNRWTRFEAGSAMFLNLKTTIERGHLFTHRERIPIKFLKEEMVDDSNAHGWYSTRASATSAFVVRQVWLQGDRIVEENVSPICYHLIREGTGDFADLWTNNGSITLPNGHKIFIHLSDRDPWERE